MYREVGLGMWSAYSKRHSCSTLLATGQRNEALVPEERTPATSVLEGCKACSCAHETSGYMNAAWTFLLAFLLILATVWLFPMRAYAASEDFVFLADTHMGQPGEPAYDDAQAALLWAGGLDNLKAVCVAGDVTDRGDAVAFSEWEYLCDSIVPDAARIQALGDHDTGKMGAYLGVDKTLTVANGYKYFKQINGNVATSYREFEHANVMTVGGVRAAGHSVITDSMLKQLNARLLKTVRQGKMAIVVCHYPFTSSVLNKRAKLMGILRSYPNVIFVSGHMHRYSTARQCQSVRPACSTTPYDRAGFDESTKYALRSVGVNACCRYRSGNYSHADELTIADNGSLTLRAWNVSKDRVVKTWNFKQATSSVTIKCAPSGSSYPKSGAFTVKVTFSDGGTYSGVKSGSTIKLKPGGSKKLAGVPAGVLVKAKITSVLSGWSKSGAKSIEVGTSAKSLKLKPVYRKAARLHTSDF